MALRYALLVALLLSLTAGRAQAGGLEMTFHQETVTVNGNDFQSVDGKLVKKGDDGAGAPQAESKDVTVRLFPNSFSIRDGKQRRIYDFAAKRVIEVDDKEKTFAPHSLYALPVFKEAEKRNRETLGKVLGKVLGAAPGKKTNVPPDAFGSAFDIDMSLGSESNAQKTAEELTSATADGKTVFSAGGVPRADFVLSETAVPDALKDSYRRFVANEIILHPAIKKSLYAAPDVFAMLHSKRQDMSLETETTWTLTDAHAVPGDDVMKPGGYKQLFVGDPKVDDAIRKAAVQTEPGLDDYAAKIKKYLDAKDTLHAALAIMEMNVALGPDAADRLPDGAETLRAALSGGLAQKVFAILVSIPHSSADFDAMIDLLGKAKAAAPDYGYLLDVYAANHAVEWLERGRKVPSGDMKTLSDARDRLVQAIAANPWLTGAYCDVGRIYFREFQTQKAWDYWNQAIRLNPGHAQLKQVVEMQQRAEKDFPEYF